MVEHKKNGLIYRTGCYSNFESCVRTLIECPQLRTDIALSASLTMNNLWAPQIAANRLYEKAKELLATGSFIPYKEGPLSVAPIINNKWFRDDTVKK